MDDAAGDLGSFSGGWSLTLSPSTINPDYVSTSGTLTFTPGSTSQNVTVTVSGDGIAESSETFFVNLITSVNATVLDAQGLATILDDDGAGGGGGGEGPWTDDPLTPGSITLKAVHITELRTRIDALRTANGLSPAVWTDDTLIPGVTVSKAVHLTELRKALGEVYTALGQTPPGYTNPDLVAGISITAVHISQLRAGVVAIE